MIESITDEELADANYFALTAEIELWRRGIEINHDGNVIFIDTPHACGAE